MGSKTWADAAKETITDNHTGQEEETKSALDLVKKLCDGMKELERAALISAAVIAVTAKQTDEIMQQGRTYFMEALTWKLIKTSASTAGLCLLMNDLTFLEELNETVSKMAKARIAKFEETRNKAN